MRLDWDAYIRDTEFMATIRRIEQRVNDLSRNVNNRGRDMEAVFDRLARTATAFLSVNMMENFISKMISVRSEFQQLEIAFTTMLGSKEKADKLTQDLIQFAGTTPFGMKETADATKQLLAYGSEAGNVKNELRMLGDVASGVSQPIGELVYLYGTLRTQGRAYMMDIRQFAGRGIPIYQELAKVLGVSKDQVNALVTAGKVGFKEVEQAFKNMTAQGSMFGGLMEAQSHTIQGNLERLGDAFDQMLNSMGKDSEGVIGMAISGLSTLVENYDKVLAIMLGLVTTYGVYKAALIATAAWESSLTLITTARRVAALALGTSVASLTAVEVLHYTALIIAEKAQRLLNATMLANPYIAVGAVVAGLIVTMYSLEKSLTASQQAQQNFTEGNRKAIESMEAMKTKATELTNIVRDKTATEFQTNKAYEELQRLYPNLLANMSKEAFLKEESTKLQKDLNNENDKSSLSVLSNRYDEAKNKVAAMTKELEGLKVAMRNDSSGGSGAAYSKLYKELEAAKIEAGLLGEELRKQQQEYAYSLMNDDQKLQFLQAQKAEIEKQRDAILKVNPQINDQNAIFGIIQDKTVNIASNLNSWNLVRFNNELTDILGKIKGIEDANKKDPNAGVRSENWFNEEIKKLKEANAPLSVYSPEYKANLAQIKKLEDELAKAQGKEKNNSARQATQVYNAQERYLGILKDIEKTKAEYSTSQLSRDQQEIAGIKARYKVLQDEIAKFNRNPKNKKKITAGQIQEVNDVRDREIQDTIYKQQTEKRLNAYQNDYDNYVKYEDLKREYGDKVADAQLGQYRGTFEKIAGEYGGLLAKQKTVGLNVFEKDRLDRLFEIIKDNGKRLKEYDTTQYTEALKAAQTLNDKILEIEKDHQKKIKEIRDKGELTPEREKVLNKDRDLKVSKLATDELTGSIEWEKLFSGMDEMGAKQIEKLISIIQKNFEKLKGKFDPIDLENLKRQLREAQDTLIGKNPFAELGRALSGIFKGASEESGQTAEDIRNHWKTLSKATAKSFDFIADAVNSAEFLREALGDVGEVAMGSLSAIAATADAVSLAMQKAETASVILAIIKAALVVMQAVTSILDRGSKKRNEELKKEQEYYNTLSETFDILIDKQKELFAVKSNKESMDAYREALDLVNSKLIANRKSLEAWFSQGASLFKHSNWYNYDKELGDVISRQQLLNMTSQEWENLLLKQPEIWARLPEEVRKYGQSMIDAKEQAKDLKDALQEALSGISMDDIKGEFENLFSQADLTFGDISDSFYKHMQKAVIRLVQDGKMTQNIQSWYDNVMKSMEDGDLTKIESDALKAEYKAIAEAGNKRYQAIMDLIGYEGDTKSSGLKSSIQRDLTESTASELAGLERSSFDMTKRIFEDGQKRTALLIQCLAANNLKLAALNAIQFNTAETVKRLDSAVSELQTMNKNLGGRY